MFFWIISRTNRFWAKLGLSMLAIAGLLALGLYCVCSVRAQRAPAPHARSASSDKSRPSASPSKQTAESMPPALKQAWIAARQSEAGKEYAWQPGEGQGQAQIRHPQGFGAAAHADQLQIGAPGQAVGMHLAALQCQGEKRQALDESRPAPKVKNRRAEYALKGGVTEWYENGPMGLEQGFTLTQPCKNPGALTLEIALTGIKSIEQTGTEADPKIKITPKDPNQKPYNYSNLYAEDAQGKALKAKMSVKEEKILLTVIATEAKYPIVVDPLVWVETQKLVAGDGKGGDQFGTSVAISGDTAVVGARSASLAATGSDAGDDRMYAGAAYVFVKSGNIWTQQAKLVAGDGQPGDWFGISVALSGDTAVIGTRFADLAATGSDAGTDRKEAGAAYVFVRSGNVWTQQTKLVAGDGKADYGFGASVALSGDTAVIGAISADPKAAGAAYVFVRSGNVWTQQDKLFAGDGRSGDWFGNSVALSGDTAVIAATDADLAATGSAAATGGRPDDRRNAGAAYVFVKSGNVWTQQDKLVAKDEKKDDNFGASAALSGDTAVIGSYHASLAATGSDFGNDRVEAGAAYVFVRSGNVWTQQAKLVARDAKTADNFGNSVALSGDTAVIGAVWADLAATGSDAGTDRYSAGAAYVFMRSGNVWTQQDKLVAGDAKTVDYFGTSVALSGDTVLVGSESGDLAADKKDTGALYSFHLGKSGGDSCGQQSDCAFLSCDQAFKKCGLPGASACHSDAQCRSGLCKEGVCTRAVGDSCGASSDCANGFCVDGVCCDGACGGGVAYDCMACSVAKGATQDGVCGAILRENNYPCQAPAAGQWCDAGAFCDGQGWLCPPDHRMKPAGTECRASQSEGDVPEFCDGATPACPADRPPVVNTPPPTPPQAPLNETPVTPQPAKSGCRCDAGLGRGSSLGAWLLPTALLALALLRRSTLRRRPL